MFSDICLLKYYSYSRDNVELGFSQDYSINLPIRHFVNTNEEIWVNSKKVGRVFFIREDESSLGALRGYLIDNEEKFERFKGDLLALNPDRYKLMNDGLEEISKQGRVKVTPELRLHLDSVLSSHQPSPWQVAFRGMGEYFLIHRITPEMRRAADDILFPIIKDK